MDYEKKYNEALDRAKQLLSKELTVDNIVEQIFPELKESEDEWIRKSLIDMLKNDEKCYLKEIAWLEKQGKQKPADKVEPKFKIGDIVKHKKNPHLTYILKRFTDDGDYEFHATGKDGNEGETCFAVVEYQDDWELVEPHSSWSEQDESRLAHILRLLDVKDDKKYLLMFGLNSLQDLEKDINWLKSLRPHNMLKPSDRDTKLLRELSDGKICPDNYRTRLYEIINNLKYL